MLRGGLPLGGGHWPLFRWFPSRPRALRTWWRSAVSVVVVDLRLSGGQRLIILLWVINGGSRFFEVGSCAGLSISGGAALGPVIGQRQHCQPRPLC